MNDTSLATTHDDRDIATIADAHTRFQRSFAEYVLSVGEILLRKRTELASHNRGTFESWVKGNCPFSDVHARRIISAYETIVRLEPTGSNPPSSERQCRELARLPMEMRIEAWQRVVAATDSPTSADVRAVVKELLSKPLPVAVPRAVGDPQEITTQAEVATEPVVETLPAPTIIEQEPATSGQPSDRTCRLEAAAARLSQPARDKMVARADEMQWTVEQIEEYLEYRLVREPADSISAEDHARLAQIAEIRSQMDPVARALVDISAPELPDKRVVDHDAWFAVTTEEIACEKIVRLLDGLRGNYDHRMLGKILADAGGRRIADQLHFDGKTASELLTKIDQVCFRASAGAIEDAHVELLRIICDSRETPAPPDCAPEDDELGMIVASAVDIDFQPQQSLTPAAPQETPMENDVRAIDIDTGATAATELASEPIPTELLMLEVNCRECNAAMLPARSVSGGWRNWTCDGCGLVKPREDASLLRHQPQVGSS